MKKLVFSLLLFISTLSFGQTLITPSFRSYVPGTSHADPILYYYPGKFGDYDTLVNLYYIRTHFAAVNDSLVLSNWFTGLGTTPSPIYIKRDSIIHLIPGTNITITGAAPNFTINASGGGTSLTGPGYVKMVSGSPTYVTSIGNSDLANSTISGVSLGGSLFAHTPGFGLTGSNYDGHNAQTWIVDSTTMATQYYARVVAGPDGILTGMGTSVSGTTATTAAGTYRLNATLHTITSTNTTIPAQDATQYRITVIYADASGVLHAANGSLSLTDPVSPTIPTNTVDIADIYIPPVGGTVTTGGGSNGKGLTSVGLSVPQALFNTPATNSPLTTNGTITISLANQLANKVFAGPSTGSPATPAFRSLVVADIPTLNQNTTGTAANITATSNSTLTTLPVLSLPYSQLTGTPSSLPPSGSAGNDLSGTYPNPTVNQINGVTKSYYDPTSSIQTQLNGKQGVLTRQVITSGSSGTVTGGNYIVTIDPTTTLAAYTLTLPASPLDMDIVQVDFGGTLTSGTIVTALTISPNSGQTILDNTPPVNATADNTLLYRYRASNTKWYRFKP